MPAAPSVAPLFVPYARRLVTPFGDLVGFSIAVVAESVRLPFAWREFVRQAWFVTSVTLLPAALVSIPFGAVLALEIGNLFRQIGAQSLTGAAAVLGIIQQAAPIATVLMISGAGGSAICADLGARKIREELDAMEVLGISVIRRLVVPRVAAMAYVALLINLVASVVGVLGGYVFNVLVQHGTPGAYLASFTSLAQLPDLYVGELKALVFGLLAGLVACWKGVTAKGGPKGVGTAVNESVIVTFVLLFLVNVVITALYFVIVPAKSA